MDQTFAELVDVGVDVRRACKLAGRPRSTHYWRRRRKPAVPVQRRSRPVPANALSPAERDRVRQLLRDPAFVDKAPAQVWAGLLDNGIYLCSQSTMYRILRESGESWERRRQATHPPKVKPELIAHAPGQVYSWDIKCRRRHLMSYADVRAMPTVPAMVQVISTDEVQKVGIVA